MARRRIRRRTRKIFVPKRVDKPHGSIIVRDLSKFRTSRARQRLGGRRFGLTITSTPGMNVIRPSSIRRVNSRRY